MINLLTVSSPFFPICAALGWRAECNATFYGGFFHCTSHRRARNGREGRCIIPWLSSSDEGARHKREPNLCENFLKQECFSWL
jgi:hypothetical protein